MVVTGFDSDLSKEEIREFFSDLPLENIIFEQRLKTKALTGKVNLIFKGKKSFKKFLAAHEKPGSLVFKG